MRNFWKLGGALAIVAAVLLVVSCTGSEGDPLGGPGTLTVNVHDQTAPGISNVYVSFSAVQAVSASGEVHNVTGIATGTQIDLTQYVGGTELTLARTDNLPAGDYVAVRLTVESLTVRLDDGTSVDVMNGMPAISVQVNVNFHVDANAETVISVDIPLTAFRFNGTDWTFDPGALTAG